MSRQPKECLIRESPAVGKPARQRRRSRAFPTGVGLPMVAAIERGTKFNKDCRMIHYSCDRCKRVIDPDCEVRYTVRMEVHAVMEDVDEVDDDRDHLLEIHEILERLNDAESELIGEDIYQRHRFDLCPECYRKYIKNPLGHEAPAEIGFSQN